MGREHDYLAVLRRPPDGGQGQHHAAGAAWLMSDGFPAMRLADEQLVEKPRNSNGLLLWQRAPLLYRGVNLSTSPGRRKVKTDAIVSIVGYRLRRAQVSVFQRFMVAFAELGLRPVEYSTLELVAGNPGSKQSQVASAVGLKRANFVIIVNQLESRGLLERRSGSSDKRAKALYLTPEGSAVLAEARGIQAQFEKDCIQRLGGEDQVGALFVLLDRLT